MDFDGDRESPCDCRDPRPYQQRSIVELEQLIEKADSAEFGELVHELRHRTTRAAVRVRGLLRDRIRLQSFTETAAAPPDSRRPQDASPPGLTDEQQEIVDSPVDGHLLVTAGPGTGKTHVLVHRIASLVRSADLAPGSEILLLTFSRAAVGEARRRVREFGGRVAWVRAYTFDSFAGGLLAEFVPDGPWSREGYDGRIRAAVRLIRENDQVAARLREYRHIFVDELQNVVGVRAELVLAILERAACGWTLFGDPAQGIYNFQLEGEARREGAAALYRELRRRFGSVHECSLTANFRAQSEEVKVGLWAGDELNGESPDYASIRLKLQTTMLRLPPAPPIGALNGLPGTVGILCPWNGQALLVSRELWKRGVVHRVRRAASDRVVPAWVGRLLLLVRTPVLGRRAFDSLWSELSISAPTVDDAWSQLRAIDPGPLSGSLDVDRIVSRIRARYLPDEFEDRDPQHITVSTIHRAKGLEYDEAFIVPVPERKRDPNDVAEESRLLYVALTRARFKLASWPAPETKGMHPVNDRGDDRWVRKGFKWYHLHAFEMQPDDTDREAPFAGAAGMSAVEVQAYLVDCVSPGDPVELRSEGDGDYVVMHGERAIGSTSSEFCRALAGQLYGRVKNWPERITDLFVESVDTVAGDSAEGERVGLSGPGVWLRVRVHGLGELKFPAKGGT